jgi:hypothetical protein
VLFLHVTTHIDGRENDDLLSDKGDRVAFPTVILLDADGERLWARPGGMSVAAYVRIVGAAQTYLDARKKGAAGGAKLKVDGFLAGVRLGLEDLRDLDKTVGDTALDDAQKRELAVLRANEALAAAARIKDRAEATAAMLEIHAGGVHPDSPEVFTYWSVLRDHAASKPDLALMEEATAALRAILEQHKDNARARDLLDKIEKELSDAKKRAAGTPK